MNQEPLIQSEVSQKNKSHILTHISMESRKRVLMNLFTGQDRDPDIENRLVDTAREGESGTN